MKRLTSGIALLAMAAAAGQSHADSLDFSLHNDALRAIYMMNLGERGLSADFGLLYSEDEKRLDDIMVHAGLHVSGDNWSESGTFNVRVGFRLIHTTPDDWEFAAFAPGAQVRYSPIHRVGFGGHLYLAPRIISFRDAERYREYGVNIDYQVLPQAFVYAGYRYIDINIENSSFRAKVEDNFHVGFRMLF